MAIRVTNIWWTRSFLEIDYFAKEPERQELFLFHEKSHCFVRFSNEVTDITDDKVFIHARLNLTLGNGREMLESGNWFLCTRFSDELLRDEQKLFETYPYLDKRAYAAVKKQVKPDRCEDESYLRAETDKRRLEIITSRPYDTHSVSYEEDLLERLDNLSKAFRYVGGKYAYVAYLIPKSDSTDYLYVVLNTQFYQRNETPKVRKKSVRFTEKRVLASVAALDAKFSERTGKRVLFLKQNGDTPTSNMAAVRDRMIERGLDTQFQIVERYREVLGQQRQSLSDWLEDMSEISKADFIFIDDYCPIFNFIKPPDGTVLTQIWHAGVGFKSVGYARFGMQGSPDPFNSPHRMYTYALIGNEHLRDIYSEVFGIEQSALLATGMPRLDHFLDEDAAQAARHKLLAAYPWMTDGRVIVYAPTFRGSGQRSAYFPYDTYFDFQKLYDMCSATNSYFVFEMHPFVKDMPPIPQEFGDRIFDLSHESLDELYHVSDALVTDYSSCFYDYLLLKKPVVFYTPDRVEYSVTRGVQRPVKEFAPGVVCDTFDDFMLVLAHRKYEDIEPDSTCIDRAAERGMLASDRVIDTILLGRDVPGVKLGD